MSFTELIALVRDWLTYLPPAEARQAVERWARGVTVTLDTLLVPATINVDAVLAFAASGKPAAEHDLGEFLRWPKLQPQPPRRRGPRRMKAVRALAPSPDNTATAQIQAVASPPKRAERGRRKVAERARVLVREQLKHGPRSESSVMAAAEAADISERTLIVAADALGVRTRRGEWWLPR